MNVSDISVYAPAEKELPVLMYHSVLEDPARTGEYVITPAALEEDLEYLSRKGYTSVTPQMIEDFCERGVPLPEKPIFLTFDDGHLNNMTYALPLLEKYNMKAVVNTVGAFTVQAEKENDPNPRYAYLTRENMEELCSGDSFYVGCHTYNMHTLGMRRGAQMMYNESSEDYINAFREDILKWRELMAGEISDSADVFAYPYGFSSEEGFSVLEECGFKIMLTCRERSNTLVFDGKPHEGIITLDRFNRSGLVQTDKFMQAHEIY